MTHTERLKTLSEKNSDHMIWKVCLRCVIPDRTNEGAESTFCLRLVNALKSGKTREEFYREQANELLSMLNT